MRIGRITAATFAVFSLFVLNTANAQFPTQGQLLLPAPQGNQNVITPPDAEEPMQQFGPASIVIRKLASMGDMEVGEVPVTQDELEDAAEFLMERAAQNGQPITRDQALVGLGYIAGSLSAFLDIAKRLPTDAGAQAKPVPLSDEAKSLPPELKANMKPSQAKPAAKPAPQQNAAPANPDLPPDLAKPGAVPSSIVVPAKGITAPGTGELPPGLVNPQQAPSNGLFVIPGSGSQPSAITGPGSSVVVPLPSNSSPYIPGFTDPEPSALTTRP